jgi:hypothetical protein
MKTLLAIFVCPLTLVLGMLAASAQEKAKEVTLKGTMMCAHCALNEGDKCQNVLQVKEGDKTVNYYFVDKGNGESYHAEICGGGKKDATVVGKVSEQAGKKMITPSKVEYAKK